MLPLGGKMAGMGEPAGRETRLQLPLPGAGSLPISRVEVTLHNDWSGPALAGDGVVTVTVAQFDVT